jgi:hypothetical protein
MQFKIFIFLLIVFIVSGCTTGQLHYVDTEGNRILACDVEFVGLPSVDKFAVEYALSLCAKNAVKRGFDIERPELLTIDTTIKLAPCGRIWDHELAKQSYNDGYLSKREYGYVVANIDLGLATVNECIDGDI